jgi:sec-independent protein translocase protein TatA
MGFDSIWHWLLLAVIVLIIFGTGKLTRIGPDLGNAVRGFKKALQGDEGEQKSQAATEEKLEAESAPSATAGAEKQEQPDSSATK